MEAMLQHLHSCCSQATSSAYRACNTVLCLCIWCRNDERAWRGLQQAGMAQDLSWEKAAVEYEQLFGWALMDPPARPW